MQDASEGVASFFTELVDAVRHSESWSESVGKQEATRKALERQRERLRGIQAEIASLFETKELDSEVAGPLAKALADFGSVAFQQATAKLEEKYKKTIDELAAEGSSFKLKSTKSLESFLATGPLPVLDEEVGVDLTGGSYAAYASYKCTGEISYEFLLNTASSSLFKGESTVSSIWKGTRLPVRLSKAWLKKEPIPDYERLDSYALQSARASGNHLTAKLTNSATMSSVSIVYSRSNSDSFITVEYADKVSKVDVTGEPSLNKHLDLPSIKQAMERTLEAIMRLDKEKLKLARLECAGRDTLVTLDCYGFMRRVAEVFARSPETMQAIRQTDARAASDRLKLLGDNGSSIATMLGLVPNPAKVP